MSWFINLKGQKFGKLLVLSQAEKKNGKIMWNCLCDCGNEKTINAQSLRRGSTNSCGCIHKEQLRKRVTKHGHSTGYKKTSEYITWKDMIRRCTKPNSTQYQNWGGRGITVCDRWRDFRHFIQDMGDKPTPKHTIERIDVNGNYELSNCRWATIDEQANNKTNNHTITAFGETKTLSDWSKDERCAVNYSTLTARINILDWQAEMAITTKSKRFKKPS